MPRSDHMVKPFLPSFLRRGKKRSGPACNAGGFLGTSLPRQRSAFDNSIKKIIKKDFSA